MSIVKKVFDLVDEIVTLGGLIDNKYIAYGLTGVDPLSVYLHTHYINPEIDNSPTYSSNIVVDTVSEGLYISRCYGRVKLGGNCLRFNDADDNDSRIILGHCQGPISAYVSYEVNDIAWGDLTGAHTKTGYTGTRTQTADARFSSDASAYRGIAYTAFTFIKDDQQIGYSPNITTIVDGLLCTPLAGGAAAFTRNPAVILYDWLINIEGYTAADIDTYSFQSLEALCDAVPTGGTLPRYRFDYNFDTPESISSGRNKIWQSFNGCSIKSQGKIKAIWDSGQMADGAGGLTSKVIEQDAISDLIAGWRFDEGSGTTAIDWSGNSHDASIVGAPVWVTGVNGQCLDLDWESAQYVNVGTNAAFNRYNAAFSICAWIYPTIDNGQLSIGTYGGNYIGFQIGRSWGFTIGEGGTTNKSIPELVPPLNQWSFVVGTFDGTYMRAYLNGVQVGSTTAVTPVSWAGQSLMMGRYNWTALYGDGKIDEVRFYGKALALSEIQSLYKVQTFNENNIVKGTFKRSQPQKYNLVRIAFKDSAKNYDTSTVYIRDDQDVEENGEIGFEESCFYITDAELARRRAQFLFNKFKYTDYECTFTAFSDASRVELYDLITISHSKAGWSNKPFIVIGYGENEEGQPTIRASAYYSGMYDDAEISAQASYASNLPNPYLPPKANTAVTASLVSPGIGFDYDSVKISITKPVNEAFYSHTEVYVSNVAGGAGTYYLAGTTSGEDIVVQGMGMFYVPGDTVYVKTVNYNEKGIPNSMPASPEASVVITGSIRLGSFYAGLYDFWGGNVAIGNAATTIVLGNLDGTPKLAMGPSADALSISNTATYPGTYIDGLGKFRAGKDGKYFLYDGTNISWNAGSTSLDTDGNLTIYNGGDITLIGNDSNPGKLIFNGTTYNVEIGANSTGNTFSISPNSSLVSGTIGSFSNPFLGLNIIAKGTVFIEAYTDSNNYSVVGTHHSPGNGSWVDLIAKYGGATIAALLQKDDYVSSFYPILGTIDIGTAVNPWGALYAASGNFTGDITLNSDLGDVTSKLIFGRTTGGNGEIAYNGTGFSSTHQLLINSSPTAGQLLVGDNYVNGSLSTFGTYYSFGSPVLGYGVKPKYGALGFVSSSSIAMPRDAILLADGFSYLHAASQTVAVGSDVTMSTLLHINGSGQVGINTSSFIGSEKLRVNGNEYLDGELQIASTGKVISGSKALTDGSATGIFEVAIPSNTSAGGTVSYSIKCFDGTDLQNRTAIISFAGVNKGGTVTSDIDEVYLAASETTIVTAGTLNDAWTITNGAGKITINLNSNTSLTPTSFIVDYVLTLNGNEVVTKL